VITSKFDRVKIKEKFYKIKSLLLRPILKDDRRLLDEIELNRRKEEKKKINQNLLSSKSFADKEGNGKFEINDHNIKKYSQMISNKNKLSNMRNRSKINYLSQRNEIFIDRNEYIDDHENDDMNIDKSMIKTQIEDNLSVKFSLKIYCFMNWKKLVFRTGDEITFYGRFFLNQRDNCIIGILGIDNDLNKIEFTENFHVLEKAKKGSKIMRKFPNSDLNFLVLKPTE
jgi:hypothetical protein